MKVAVYARYSSENQKESSIKDQERVCEQRAAKEGWTITHRYKDEAISGTTAQRPGYQQMLTDAKARLFDVLLVHDFSRLSRDMDETEQARKRLVYWGVRLIGVSDGIDTSLRGHKLHSRFKGMMNEEFVEKLAEDIKRGMEGQARNGFHCGGRSYGYRLVPQYDRSTKNAYNEPTQIGAKLAVDEEQAMWVRWIFERYAEGQSPLKIVAELNRRGIPPPGAHYRRKAAHTPTWAASVLQGDMRIGTGLLNNPLYRGLYVWNRFKTMTDPETGRKTRLLREKHEWVEKEIADLRIIDEDLWERVTTRRRAVGQAVARLREALHCRARSTGRNPKYLFSGLLVCGQCGENFVVVDPAYYGCTKRRGGGDAACSNNLKASRKLVESLLLEAIQRDLFTEEGIALFRDEVALLLADHRRTQAPDTKRAQAKLRDVEQELANIMTAIKAGILTPTTKLELEKAEAERERLRQLIHGHQAALDKVATIMPNLVRRFKALVDELATVTQHQVDKARGILRDLLGGQIVLHPTADGIDRYLTAELSGDYAGLVTLVCGQKLKLASLTRSQSDPFEK